ncbi:MAG TPA: peptidoglycan-binding protein [Actinomycetota bacterium]|nr:peptidoglycan-binding protein [Actinomycetota bacterium]
MELIRVGDRGEAVRDVQHRLLDAGHRVQPDELDGSFGPATRAAVQAFQRARGLPPDGIVGPDTWAQLVEAGYRIGDRTLYLRSPAFRGDDVRELQRMLNALGFDVGKEDGIFGPRTTRGVREFQLNVGAKVDGIVGLDTVRSLEGMRPTVAGPSRALVREAEAARRMGIALAGSTIAVDAGHGPSDPGLEVGGIVEAEIASRVAECLAAELERRGARAVPLRPAGRDVELADRVRRANTSDAALCVSLHLGGGELAAAGVVCCYYGTPSTHSPMGLLLAASIRDHLLRIGLPDGGVHPLAISILRETRMPAVQVELAVVANPAEVRAVRDPTFAPRAANAIADGVEVFLGAGRPSQVGAVVR